MSARVKMPSLRAFLWRLLHRTELAGDGVCPPYLVTYRLFKTRWGGLYLHQFLADDWSLDLHDHPYPMVSIGLTGGYDEETATGLIRWTAPWCRMFSASHAHRIRLRDGQPCWTLVLALPGHQPWGFYSQGQWIPAGTYMAGSARRACE